MEPATSLLTYYVLLTSLPTFQRRAYANEVNLVVLLPSSGYWPVGRTMLGAIPIATEYINTHPTLLPGRRLRFLWNDTRCHTGTGLGEAINLRLQLWEDLHAVIGPGCDNVCEPVGLLAAHWNLPMLSWGCQSHALSYKDDYPTTARTVGSYDKVAPVIASLWDHYGWREGSILSSTEHVWQLASAELRQEMERGGKVVREIQTFEAGHETFNYDDREEHKKTLKDISKHSRVLVLCAYGGDVRDIMLNALDLGLLNGRYAFITIDLSPAAVHGNNTWMGDDGRDEEAREAFDGIINIHLLTPDTPRYRNFEKEVRRRSALHPFYQVIQEEEEIDVHAGMLHDAIFVYAHALHDALGDGHDERDGRTIVQYMLNRTFQGGVTGDIDLDINGDRNSDFALQTVHNGKLTDFADHKFSTNQIRLKSEVVVLFPGGSNVAPVDRPRCGWLNELCISNSAIITFIAIGTGVIGIGVIIGIIAIVYRKLKKEMDFNNQQLWKISPSNLIKIKFESEFGSRFAGRSREGSIATFGTAVHRGTSGKGSAIIAKYKGVVVFMKSIPRISKALSVDKDLLAELKQLISIQHDNVNPFFGLCLEETDHHIVTGYCTRGSLEDVLGDDRIRLNADFKLSIAMDICKGMEFLHNSSIGTHGRLKSSNCVVDNRWVVKITDFGIQSFKPWNIKAISDFSPREFKNLLWTAPELLRHGMTMVAMGSKKGDVYSYGIILSEIVCRDGPYGNSDKDPSEIVRLVMRGHPRFRPHVPPEMCIPRMKNLLEYCWNEIPEQRPQFTTIHRLLKAMNKGCEINVMDNMIKMMEQYAENLEEIVSTRTRELEEEKKKTDMLLHQMLPSSVADSLKLGKNVCPEAYSSATVYFSDIVRFTEIAALSSPMQVVNFLNDLYSTFDAMIDNHDVYKVETIGDAYMVVSGVPEQNGIKHAGAIATLSLDILSSVNDFTIQHLPNERLKLRIGFHSGSVVAGVVGLKMPRYCLFGDTVNVAARMESRGLALRIHITQETKELLDELGGYEMVQRGSVEIKGKGVMKTYWLTGKEGFDKSLPDFTVHPFLEEVTSDNSESL